VNHFVDVHPLLRVFKCWKRHVKTPNEFAVSQGVRLMSRPELQRRRALDRKRSPQPVNEAERAIRRPEAWERKPAAEAVLRRLRPTRQNIPIRQARARIKSDRLLG
jgi:hypothetical protein